MFDSGTPVEIKCPICGRLQVVDLYAWQINQTPYYLGIPGVWMRGHPYTCGGDHPYAEMVPVWESEEDQERGDLLADHMSQSLESRRRSNDHN